MIMKNDNENNKNENKNDNDSNKQLRVSGQFLFYIFFYERYFKCKKHKQKHLSNIQPNISISKKSI